jgi:hypothetical protein
VSDIEVDPRNTATHRAAKLAVIVLSALIILALIGLVVGMILQFSGRAPGGGQATGGVFALAPGAKVVSVQTQPSRLVLQVHSDKGDEVDIVSLDDGHLIARIGPRP